MGVGISQRQFDTVCALMADPSRNVFLIGGRMSDSIAVLLSMHLRSEEHTSELQSP